MEKKSILEDNKGLSGVYLWYNNTNSKYYIGQASNLGGKKEGRLVRYYHNSYVSKYSKGKSKSLILKAILKYGLESFSLAVLEYCDIEFLDEREQFWLDFLKPEYNILKFVKSSRGYTHSPESLKKMKGKRPQFKPSLAHRLKISISNKNRVYTEAYRNGVSLRNGLTIYVYKDKNGKEELVQTFSSIIRLKKAHGLKLHHKTLYKYISEGKLFNGYRFSFNQSTLDTNSKFTKSLACSVRRPPNEKYKRKKIQLTNIVNPEFSKSFESLNSAAIYIKDIDLASDRATMRKYINQNKAYKKT